jgi:hypothetical protein
VDQELLLRTVREYYPTIFKDLVDPEDATFHVQKKPTINSGWEFLWSADDEFRALVVSVVMALRRRRLWFDPSIAIDIADDTGPNFGLLLQGMCSLEMNIRVGKLPIP